MGASIPLNWLTIGSVALFAMSRIAVRSRHGHLLPGSLRCLWIFFVVFSAATWLSPTVAIWILALTSFGALREYFSLADIRLGDRFGILAAYLSIPLMTYAIQIDSIRLFMASVPVAAFLVVPFLVVLGNRDPKGSIVSVGIIDFGLFLLVFCVGHLGYLLTVSIWTTIALVLSIPLTESILAIVARKSHSIGQYAISAPVTVLLFALASDWTGLPFVHSIALGLIVPAATLMGRLTLRAIQNDLGVAPNTAESGRGKVIASMGAYLFPAPVVFHYLYFFTGAGA